ncbi:MAG: prolyl oligopeptidase family serine peptidase [Lautropia sp.]|nr:prolyl oligopeptidase family serine peptidase [Lautropia sp.]
MYTIRQRLLAGLIGSVLIGGCSVIPIDSARDSDPYTAVKQSRIQIQGKEGGPNVPRVIIELADPVEAVDPALIEVRTAGRLRKVRQVYVSDQEGRPQAGGRFITLDLTTPFDAERVRYHASPFGYDTGKLMNVWATEYRVQATIPSLYIGGKKYSLSIDEDLIDRRFSPDTASFNVRSTFSGTYRNPKTRRSERLTLQTAAFQPEHLQGGERNPLIIWLHGQGEGGTDPDIVLLGNEAIALAKPPIQSYFSAGDQHGAYVLVVQTPTYWMDEGDGTNGGGAGHSRYTGILMDTIRQYVASNPDVDPKRIYIGGNSNGGYMTMEMIIEHPDEFAAAYPICEAYAFNELQRNARGDYVQNPDGFASGSFLSTRKRWLTDGKIERIRDLPIWFIASADDDIVTPAKYSLPSYRALLNAGADNAWFSYFQSIEGSDEPSVRYPGHFSWIYVLNDQVRGVQDRKSILNADPDDPTAGFKADNLNYGGHANASVGAKTYDNLFIWMNDQRKP